MENKINELSVSDAIKQGFTMYGFGGCEWQVTNDLHDDVFDEVDPEDWENLVLFEKTSSQPSIDSKTIAERLADLIADEDSDNCGRDDDRVYKTVMEMDFEDVAKMINDKLSEHKYWMITDIKLTK